MLALQVHVQPSPIGPALEIGEKANFRVGFFLAKHCLLEVIIDLVGALIQVHAIGDSQVFPPIQPAALRAALLRSQAGLVLPAAWARPCATLRARPARSCLSRHWPSANAQPLYLVVLVQRWSLFQGDRFSCDPFSGDRWYREASPHCRDPGASAQVVIT